MKLKDAERIAKATAAFLERLKASRAKLEAAEKRALAAVEAVVTINSEISTAFTRWSDLIEELDPDAELDALIEESDVLLKIDDLTEAIEGAFEGTGSELDTSEEYFEDVLARAQEYEEPEEEEDEDEDEETEDEDEEEEESIFTCDHPGCKAETGDDSVDEAKALGWEIRAEPAPRGAVKWVSFCPKHAR